MYGRNDFHEFCPNDLDCEEPDFRTIPEYLDIEASRSRTLITSTNQGKIVNRICLQIYESLHKHNYRFTMNVEPIYQMAVIRLTAESASVNHILMPLFGEFRDEIAEAEIFSWTLTDSMVLIFIDNVFEEVLLDETDFLFESDSFEVLCNFSKKRLSESDISYEDDIDYGDAEAAGTSVYKKIQDILPAILPDLGNCYMINQKKVAVVNMTYHFLRKILDNSNAKYKIDFLEDSSLADWVTIQVVTDAFDPNDCDNTIESYRYIINNTDLLHQNVHNGKIVMTFSIRDVIENISRN